MSAAYTFGPTRCGCHPETCCHWHYSVYEPSGERHSSYQTEDEAKHVSEALNQYKEPQ
jgi:hypothetical protein